MAPVWAKDRPVSAGAEDGGVTGRGHSGAPLRGAHSSGGPSASLLPPWVRRRSLLAPPLVTRCARRRHRRPRPSGTWRLSLRLRHPLSCTRSVTTSAGHWGGPTRLPTRLPSRGSRPPGSPGHAHCPCVPGSQRRAGARGGAAGLGPGQPALDGTPGAVGCYTVLGVGTD